MKTYRTFKRTCKNWAEFANAEKSEVETHLDYNEAAAACKEYNCNLTEKEKEEGTKMEFEEE